MGLGVPEPRLSLRDRVASKAPYAVDTGGLSGSTSGPSPMARGGYDGYDETTRFTAPGTNMRGARLIQRIRPVTIPKEYEGGGP